MRSSVETKCFSNPTICLFPIAPRPGDSSPPHYSSASISLFVTRPDPMNHTSKSPSSTAEEGASLPHPQPQPTLLTCCGFWQRINYKGHYTNNILQAINRLPPPSDRPCVIALVMPHRLTSWLWWCLTDSPHPDQPEPSLTNLNQNPQTLTQAELAGIELGEYLLSRMKTRIGCQKVRSGGGDETLVTLQKGSCRINVKTLPLAISSS